MILKRTYYTYFNMKKKLLLIVLCLSWILFTVWVNLFIVISTKPFISNTLENIGENRVWIVLWAKVKIGGIPSDILKDRLDGSINAYKIGKIQRIIVSGDNSTVEYDEPTVMKEYLVKNWISEKDISLDYAGFDTYDSLYRAKEIFWVSKITIFTQWFHLPRSVFIAQNIWIDALGFATDYHIYTSERKNEFRETFARLKAWFDVKIWHSKPKFLGEPIIIK